MKQTELKVLREIDLPFKEEQIPIIMRQFLQATISVNLPIRWIENPEIIKLFLMFCSQALNVLPSHHVLADRLLGEEGNQVQKKLEVELKGVCVTLS